MTKKVIEASMAVALATKLCKPTVIPMYPITPQTHIVERLSDFISDGELDAEMIHVESEHSAISAAIGASATGVRTFTATASQGLALMHEVLHVVSGMRLPIVMAVANRALSAPINIWNDHQDSISARDTGWIQIYVESAQEAFDAIIQAYKVAEDKGVLLPIMVCLDGFTLSHVYEPVIIESQKNVSRFLPNFKAGYVTLDSSKPASLGPIAFPNQYMEIKHDQQTAMLDSLKTIKKVHDDYSKMFGRGYGNGLIETYKMDDADYAILGMGTLCGTARVVIDKLRSEGKKVGLIKLRCYRPFPAKDLKKYLRHLKGLAVLDRGLSYGSEGAVYTDVVASMRNTDTIINGFIAGLGGRDITPWQIEEALNNIETHKETRWLF